MSRAQSVLFKSLSYLGMVALIVVIGLPVFWLVTGAFKGNREILTATPQFLPKSFNFDNFARAWTGAKFSTYYVNSIATTLMGATAEIVMAVTTAYALVFVRFPFRNAVFILLLLALMALSRSPLCRTSASLAWGYTKKAGPSISVICAADGHLLPSMIAFGTFCCASIQDDSNGPDGRRKGRRGRPLLDHDQCHRPGRDASHRHDRPAVVHRQVERIPVAAHRHLL
jgi:ABC-type spermidine/putrescine transport system permease subunit II